MVGVTDPRRHYLSRLDAALVGPRRTRRSLLREASDHLDDATDALVAAGHEPDDAARRAVADFGTVGEVAPDFQTTLAVAASRRTAWLLLVVLGCQPFLWDNGLNLASGGTESSGPLLSWLNEAIELGGTVVMAGALVAILLTGIGNRWFSLGRLSARVSAVFTLVAVATVVALSLSMTLVSGSGTPTLWAEMALLMALPMAGVAASARGTLAAT